MTENSSNKQPQTTVEKPRKRKRWRSVALGIAILLLGTVLGSGLTIVVMHKKFINAIHHPEKAPERISWRIKHRLGLTDAQRAQVQNILVKRQKALINIWKKAWPQVNEQLNGIETDVSALLNPEQNKLWKARLKYLRKKWMLDSGKKEESKEGTREKKDSLETSSRWNGFAGLPRTASRKLRGMGKTVRETCGDWAATIGMLGGEGMLTF